MSSAAPECSLKVQCWWGGEGRAGKELTVLVELGLKVHSFNESISRPKLLLEHLLCAN